MIPYVTIARTVATALGRQLDLQDVIYHAQPCNVDSIRLNFLFTTNGR